MAVPYKLGLDGLARIDMGVGTWRVFHAFSSGQMEGSEVSQARRVNLASWGVV